jgi:hypothetical protein
MPSPLHRGHCGHPRHHPRKCGTWWAMPIIGIFEHRSTLLMVVMVSKANAGETLLRRPVIPYGGVSAHHRSFLPFLHYIFTSIPTVSHVVFSYKRHQRCSRQHTHSPATNMPRLLPTTYAMLGHQDPPPPPEPTPPPSDDRK